MNPISGCINVADYVDSSGKEEVSGALQELIERSPNRTLFFPDGTYRLAKPILTPADPRRSVSLHLTDFAVLKADEDWTSPEAMVRLGALYPANDISTDGSNYSLTGGIIDGSGVAPGVSIDGGRETAVHHVSIKHTPLGLHIKHGANNGSSDADISNVNIVGTGAVNSVGILIEGYDNTVSFSRIANVFTGVRVIGGGNILRSIHPLYYIGNLENYRESSAFLIEGSGNFYEHCYSDQFGIGFHIKGDCRDTAMNNCMCYWYSPKEGRHAAIVTEKRFRASVTNFRVSFCHPEAENRVLITGEPGGDGVFSHLMLDRKSLLADREFEKYLQCNMQCNMQSNMHGSVLYAHPE